MQKRLKHLDDDHIESLRDVFFIPTTTGLAPARSTVRPGGFVDHLQITHSLDPSVARRLQAVLRRLKVQPLKFVDYVREHLPPALNSDEAFENTVLVAFIRDCARQQDELESDSTLVEALREMDFVPCRDNERRTPRETYFDSPDVLSVLGERDDFVAPEIRRRSTSAAFLRMLGGSDSPRPDDIVARVDEVTNDGVPAAARRHQVGAIVAFLAKSPELRESQDLIASLRVRQWLPAEGDDSNWHQPGETYRSTRRWLFESSGRFIRFTAAEQQAFAAALSALKVHEEPPVDLVVKHVSNLADRGVAAATRIFKWLDGKAHEDDIHSLRNIAFLPSREDGSLHPPARIFREVHALSERLPVLERRLLTFSSLLDELEVLPRPKGDQAVELLAEIGTGRGSGTSITDDDARIVRACWTLIALDLETNLGPIQELPVVPDDKNRVWSPGDVVFNDQPEALRWLTQALRERVVPDQGRGAAYARAGVGALSDRLVANVLNRGSCKRDTGLEAVLMARQLHLARIVVAEYGDPALLLEVAQRLRVRSTERLRVRYSIRGISDTTQTEPVGRAALYARTSGELFVEVPEVSWRDVANALKSAVLPDAGPAVLLPMARVLACETDAEATDLLTEFDYPKLDRSTWEEIQAVLRDWEATRRDEEEPQVEEEPEDDEEPEEAEDDEEPEEPEDEEEPEEPEDEEEPEEPEDEEEPEEPEDEEEPEEPEDEEEPEEPEDEEEPEEPEDEEEPEEPEDEEEPEEPEDEEDDEKRKKRRKKRSSSNQRLVSYVNNGDDREEKDSRDEDSGKRTQAGEAGVDLVVAHLRKQFHGLGYDVRKMPDKNKGFDVLVMDASNRPIEWIEVKSTEDNWGLRGVGLSGSQFALALKKGKKYWLYVVEHLYELEARIWWIQDPARRVTNFQYDDGWTQAAEGSDWVSGARPPKAPGLMA